MAIRKNFYWMLGDPAAADASDADPRMPDENAGPIPTVGFDIFGRPLSDVTAGSPPVGAGDIPPSLDVFGRPLSDITTGSPPVGPGDVPPSLDFLPSDRVGDMPSPLPDPFPFFGRALPAFLDLPNPPPSDHAPPVDPTNGPPVPDVSSLTGLGPVGGLSSDRIVDVPPPVANGLPLFGRAYLDSPTSGGGPNPPPSDRGPPVNLTGVAPPADAPSPDRVGLSGNVLPDTFGDIPNWPPAGYAGPPADRTNVSDRGNDDLDRANTGGAFANPVEHDGAAAVLGPLMDPHGAIQAAYLPPPQDDASLQIMLTGSWHL